LHGLPDPAAFAGLRVIRRGTQQTKRVVVVVQLPGLILERWFNPEGLPDADLDGLPGIGRDDVGLDGRTRDLRR